MCSAPTKAISSRNGDMYSVLIEEKPSRLFATSATSAGTAPSRTILAATGIVQNARPWRAPNGWPKGRPSCCRSRISTLYLRCLKTSVAWHSRMRQIYRILFRAASETLLTIAADPKHLGASIGFLAVLHTWGQNLHLH